MEAVPPDTIRPKPWKHLFSPLAGLIGLLLILGALFITFDRREGSARYTEALRHGKALGLHMPEEPQAAPAFLLPDLSGKVVALEDLQGKVVFLNFWATWCPPCRAEMPAMERLFQRMQGKDFALLAINFQESRQQVEEFMQEFQLHFPALLDSEGVAGTAYRVIGLPTTYILDRKGRIVASVVGSREWDSEEAYAFFDRLLAAR